MRLPPTTLYIDTEVFVRAGLRIETGILGCLRDTFAKGGLRLLVHPIMERELHAKFSDQADKAAKALIKAYRTHPIKALQFPDLPTEEDLKSQCYEEMLQQWIAFKQHFVVEELPIHGRSEDVFDWYFDGKPPFGIGKKKHEFPDAFVLSAIDQYYEEHEANIAVVSNDGDFGEASKLRRFVKHFSSLDEYIDAFKPELDSKDRERPAIDPTIPITTEDLTVLKEILGRGNEATSLEITRVLKLLESRGTNYDYFFRHAESAVWLEHLISHGYFENPPDPEMTPDGRQWIPDWLPIQYLVRVYEAKPDTVLEQIEKLPATSNRRILDCIMDIVLQASSVEVVNRLSSRILAFMDHSEMGHGQDN